MFVVALWHGYKLALLFWLLAVNPSLRQEFVCTSVQQIGNPAPGSRESLEVHSFQAKSKSGEREGRRLWIANLRAVGDFKPHLQATSSSRLSRLEGVMISLLYEMEQSLHKLIIPLGTEVNHTLSLNGVHRYLGSYR